MMKRGRDIETASPTTSVAAWCLRRDDLAQAVDLPHFASHATGCWVRAVTQKQTYAACCVQGIGRAPKPYSLFDATGSSVPCRTVVLLRNPVTVSMRE